MFDLFDWLGSLAEETATHTLIILAALICLGILGLVTLAGQNAWWWLHDRFSKYGARREPPSPPA